MIKPIILNRSRDDQIDDTTQSLIKSIGKMSEALPLHI